MVNENQNKHAAADLVQMQALPLDAKIRMTKRRIRDWYDYWDGNVYVSFSGGKDSTVLKHIVDSMYNDVPAVFVNTGLEYPEIQSFVREIKAGKYDCFNSDVEMLRPEMRFDEVIETYGYPVASKQIANTVRLAKPNNTRWKNLHGENMGKSGEGSMYNCQKWKFLLDAPFKVSEQCCDIMKKKPTKVYEKQTERKPMLALMATESHKRYAGWLKTGCNAFEMARPQSQPMAFWTEQDVLEYLVAFDVPYCRVYGEICAAGEVAGQMFIDGIHPKLTTTGLKRTGCMFCMFGVHLEKEPNRFQQMKQTHPKQYDYCINKLGLKEVLEYIGVDYE